MDINEVKPYSHNPRNNKDAVNATANSIKAFGWQQPIVIDTEHVIIAGHTRLKAAKKLDCKKVPVVIASNLSPEQVKAYRLADNETHDLSSWEKDELGNELADIEDIDMSQFGFTLDPPKDDDSDETDISDDIPQKLQVIVNCKDEEDLENTFNKLKKMGYDVDVSTM